MSETRTVVERKMQRIAAPTFSQEDILERRDRRDRHRRVAAGALAFALFLPVLTWFALESRHAGVTPIGGGQPAATFVRDAGDICAWGRSEFERITPLAAPRGDWPFSRSVAYYGKGLPIFRDVISQLRRLTPPPTIAGSARAAIDAHERSIETMARAIEAGEAGHRPVFYRLIRRTLGPMDARLVAAYERVDPDIDCP
jgi:hypothetical protein